MLTLKLVGLDLQIVLQTFDGLPLANHTLASSLQPFFFAPVLSYHPLLTSIRRRKIIQNANIILTNTVFHLNHWVMHPVARVSTNIVETSVPIKRAPTFVAYGGFYTISYCISCLECVHIESRRVTNCIELTSFVVLLSPTKQMREYYFKVVNDHLLQHSSHFIIRHA
jgi:hypothetical protein